MINKKITMFSFMVAGVVTLLTATECEVRGVKSNDMLTARELPSYKSKIVGKLAPIASGIDLIKCKKVSNSSIWYKIRDVSLGGSLLIGWVNKKFLSCQEDIASCCIYRVAENDTLTVRTSLAVSSKKIGELSPHTTGIKKIRCVEKWCKIRYTLEINEIIGWVNSRYLRLYKNDEGEGA
jgi:hypothetical protein